MGQQTQVKTTSALHLSSSKLTVDFELGISYIATSSSAQCASRDVHVILTYPGTGGGSTWKTTSRIAYKSENGGCSTNQWGFQVTPKMVSYSWTKLLLDQNAYATDFDDPSLKKSEGEGLLTLPLNKTAIQVVSDYLTEVYQWTMDHLAKRFSPEILATIPVEFWFTVPAIWSDQAKEATLSAATVAGFGSGIGQKIFLIPEPEAAAVATLESISDEGAFLSASVQPGDGIIICDYGGGTVDITSYKVVQLSPRLEFEELVDGIGGKCGSTYIDRLFHKFMSKIFGTHFDDLPFEKKGPGSKFMKEFEAHKHSFGSSEDMDELYEVSLVMRGVSSASEFYDDEESVVQLRGQVHSVKGSKRLLTVEQNSYADAF